MKSIEIEVDAQGGVSIEAVGFKGSACEAATKAMEQALGVETSRKRKVEYYMANTTNKQQVKR